MVYFIVYLAVLFLVGLVFNSFTPFWLLTGDLSVASAGGEEFYIPLVTGFLISLVIFALIYFFKQIEG